MTALAFILSLMLPLCEYEDEGNCYWDARALGNGIGDSSVRVLGFTLPT